MKIFLQISLVLLPWVAFAQDTEEYWNNGQVKSRGSFAKDSLIWCQVAGPDYLSPYQYKVGYWEYWHANGQKLAEGTFIPTLKKVDNNCGGGTKGHVGKFSMDWKCWNDNGEERKLDWAISNGFITIVDPIKASF